MPKCAVTICLVDEARQGPFVFHQGLAHGCETAAKLGFDGVEVFAPAADVVNQEELSNLLTQHGLELAAVGTGAGALLQGLTLSDDDPAVRGAAVTFIKEVIAMGAVFSAPAIIGSMQGSSNAKVSREQALAYFADALEELGHYAEHSGVPLLYEPINRYESNLFARDMVEGPLSLLSSLKTNNVKILADLFHFNFETPDTAEAVKALGDKLGHVHFVDNTRNPAGMGHTDFAAIASVIKELGYEGYLSAECFPYPDEEAAAQQTISCFRDFF